MARPPKLYLQSGHDRPSHSTNAARGRKCGSHWECPRSVDRIDHPNSSARQAGKIVFRLRRASHIGTGFGKVATKQLSTAMSASLTGVPSFFCQTVCVFRSTAWQAPQHRVPRRPAENNPRRGRSLRITACYAVQSRAGWPIGWTTIFCRAIRGDCTTNAAGFDLR